MRRLLKFLHTMGAAGLIGAMASLLVLLIVAPSPSDPAEYVSAYAAMSAIATWILLPSLTVTLIAGLLAIAWNRAFHNAGWAWAKLGSGVLVFEGGLVNIQGPIKEEAERSAAALATHWDAAAATGLSGSEQGSIWVILAVSVVNVVLGVWRPRFSRRPDAATS
jgi:hypothetical protein